MAILTFTWPSQSVTIPGAALESTQLQVLGQAQNINAKVSDIADVQLPALALDVAASTVSLASIDSKLTNPLPVSGPLTDAELRATAVPVSGPLTDAQLRATPVPVSTTDLDIRDLVFATDKVDVSGSSVTVSATNLDIRDLSSATDSVTVVASNLDVRDLVFATDKVDVSGSTVTANAGTGTFAVSAASLPLPADAATETTLSALNTKVPANLTVSSTRLLVDGSGVTQPVSLASAPAATGRSSVQILRNDYSSVNVTTGAYVQLTASTSGTINKLQIFDSSGSVLVLATGAAASEVDRIYIFPGGNGDVELNVPSGTRLSIKAVDTNATVGQLLINALS